MIPSHWFRQAILIVFIMEIAGGILWITSRLSTNPAAKPMTQALSSLIFLFGSYTNAPLPARFSAPRPSQDAVLQERLARIVTTIPDSHPVLLHDHIGKEASTAGLLPSHSCIYVTTGLLASMSDEGMRDVIAHENAHVHERYIFAMFTYVCCFAVSSRSLDSNNFLFTAFLLFLGICRYCEYRVDTGAVQSVGREVTLTALHGLAVLYPSKSWVHWFLFANVYPTLIMRIQAVEAGREALL